MVVERPSGSGPAPAPGVEGHVGTGLRRYARDRPHNVDGLRDLTEQGESQGVARALCPGSFDPVTNGHLDIIERTARHFDDVIVAVIRNPQKAESLVHARGAPGDAAGGHRHLPNVQIESFKGLLVDYAKEHDAQAIVKGLRAVSDFDYELQMAQMNQRCPGSTRSSSPPARSTRSCRRAWCARSRGSGAT